MDSQNGGRRIAFLRLVTIIRLLRRLRITLVVATTTTTNQKSEDRTFQEKRFKYIRRETQYLHNTYCLFRFISGLDVG